MIVNTYWGRLHEKTKIFAVANDYSNGDLVQVLDKFVRNLIGEDIWDYCPQMHIFLTDKTTNSDRLYQFEPNLVNPLRTNAAFRLTYTANPTATLQHLGFNGTTQYADCYLDWSVHMSGKENNCGQMTYFTGTTLGVSGVITSSPFRANQTILNNGSATNGALNSNTGTTSTRPNASGCFAVKREAGNIQKIFYRGSLEATATTTMNGLPTGVTKNIGRRSGVAVLYGSNPINFDCVFHSLSDSKVIILDGLVNTYNGEVDFVQGLSGSSARKKY